MVTGPVSVPFFSYVDRQPSGYTAAQAVGVVFAQTVEFFISFSWPVLYPQSYIASRVEDFPRESVFCAYHVVLNTTDDPDAVFLWKVKSVARMVLQSICFYWAPLIFPLFLISKIFVRELESYYNPPLAPAPLPVPVPVIPPFVPTPPPPTLYSIQQSRDSTSHQWYQKWLSSALFPVFAQGIDLLTQTPLIANEQDWNNGPQITLVIQNVGQEYPLPFLNNLEYFCAYFRWLRATSDQLSLSGSFPYTHDELCYLKDKMVGNETLSSKEYEFFSFLLPTEGIEGLGPNYTRLFDRAQEMNAPENSPGVKVPSCTFDIDLGVDLSEDPSKALKAALALPNERHKYYLCNKILNEHIVTLHSQGLKGAHFLDQIQNLSTEAQNYITILQLPSSLFAQADAAAMLNQLLPRFPKLLWLQVDTFSFPLCVDDLTTVIPSLQILSLTGTVRTRNRLGTWDNAKNLFPNVDILEIER